MASILPFFFCLQNPKTRLWLLVAPWLPDQPLKAMNSALASGLHIHPHCVYQGKVNCTHSLFTRKISPFRWHGPKVGSLKPLPAAAGKRQSQDVSSHIGLGWTCSCCVGLGASSGLWGTLLEGTWAGLRRASSKGGRYVGIHKDSLNGIISIRNTQTTPGLSGLYRNVVTAFSLLCILVVGNKETHSTSKVQMPQEGAASVPLPQQPPARWTRDWVLEMHHPWCADLPAQMRRQVGDVLRSTVL